MQLSVSVSAFPIGSSATYAPEGKDVHLSYNIHAKEHLFSNEGSIVGGGSVMLSLDEARDLLAQLSEAISRIESDALKSFS